jgi:hypothetical protein
MNIGAVAYSAPRLSVLPSPRRRGFQRTPLSNRAGFVPFNIASVLILLASGLMASLEYTVEKAVRREYGKLR